MTRLLLVAMLALATAFAAPAHAADCRIGAYRLADGAVVDVNGADDAALRWRREDGTTGLLKHAAGDRWTSTLGWTGRPDGKTVAFDCAAGTIDFAGTARMP